MDEADIGVLMGKLRSNDIYKRENAVGTLINPENRTKVTDADVQELIQLFENEAEAPVVRSRVAIVLGHLADERAIGPLMKPIRDDVDQKAVDFDVLYNAPTALGMILQSMIQRKSPYSFGEWTDPRNVIMSAVGLLDQSLRAKTREYQSGELFKRSDLRKALHENISYRLELIRAFKMIGAVGSVVDSVSSVFHAEPVREDISVLDEAAEALGWIGLSEFFWDTEAFGITIGFSGKEQAMGELELIIRMPAMYPQVKETARKALQLMENI